MSRVAEVMQKLPGKFQPQAAADLNAVFQIEIDDDHAWHISIDSDGCRVVPAAHDDPDVTLFMDSDTFVEIIDGDLGGTSAFLSGRIRAEGNVMLATRLGGLFKR